MDPILIDVPQELITKRLRVRLPRVGDGAGIAAVAIASRAELWPYLPWATESYGNDDGELWCRRSIARFILREQLSYSIRDRQTDEFLGGIGSHHIDWKARLCEIGYWLRTDRVGQGYMSEALAAVVEMLKALNFRRLEIRCDERNTRSAAVAKRGGFDHEGTLRENALDPSGSPRSTMIFSRISAVG